MGQRGSELTRRNRDRSPDRSDEKREREYAGRRGRGVLDMRGRRVLDMRGRGVLDMSGR